MPRKGTVHNWCFTSYVIGEKKFNEETMRYMVYQEEVCPKTQRHHIQGYVQFRMAISLKKVKSVFGEAEMHLEPQSPDATAEQAAAYCKKLESRALGGVVGEFGHLVSRGQRSDLLLLKDAIDSGSELVDLTKNVEVFATLARNFTFTKALLNLRVEEKGKEKVMADMKKVELFQWQAEIVDMVDGKIDDRKVFWFEDKKGAAGKSFLAKWLCVMRDACVLSPGRLVDMASLIQRHKWPPKRDWCVVFDVTRTNQKGEKSWDPLDDTYKLIEMLKSGIVQSTKYEVAMLYGAWHVLVFSNFHPDTSALSMDRWSLHELLAGEIIPPLPMPPLSPSMLATPPSPPI